MELYSIPFEDNYIIYRPLRGLAFIGNRVLADYIRERAGAGAPSSVPSGRAVEQFLDSIHFWQDDLPGPKVWEPGEHHRPTIAVLMMTSACNLRCTYCYARGGEGERREMSLQLAKTVIDRACQNALHSGRESYSLVFHGGGEPTLNWNVMQEAVLYAKDQVLPCHVNMSSNGIWSTLQREFILAHFSSVSVSFDGRQDIQDRQRPLAGGGSSFNQVMKTIRELDRIGMQYGIRMTVTPESVQYLPENIEFLCRETGQAALQVEPAYGRVRGQYSDPTPDQAAEFASFFFQAFCRAQEHNRDLIYSGCRPGNISGCFCQAPQEALIVTPEGDVVTCFEIHDRRHPYLNDFVIGRARPGCIAIDMERVRSFAHLQGLHREECQNCFCFWHCGGDCASRRIASPAAKRWRCEVNRSLTRDTIAWYIARSGGVWKASLPGMVCSCGGAAPETGSE